jgi:RNA polymerase primary sigma factor
MEWAWHVKGGNGASFMRIAEGREVSLMAIDQYMRQVRWTPQLTDEEEAHLVESVMRGRAECGKSCPDAQVLADARRAWDRLVEGYQGLVVFLATKRQFLFRSMELPDLIQEGNMGLMQALEDYDVGCGYPLATVIGHFVRHAMWEALRSRDRLIRLPGHVHKAVSRLDRLRHELLAVLDHEPSSAELAGAMGVSEEALVELEQAERCQEVASLQALVAQADGEDYSHEDYVHLVSVFEAAGEARQAHQGLFEGMLRQAMQTALNKRQRDVLQLRYGFDEGGSSVRSKRAVAELLGVSDVAVGQAERVAIKRLYMVLAPFYAEGYAAV